MEEKKCGKKRCGICGGSEKTLDGLCFTCVAVNRENKCSMCNRALAVFCPFCHDEFRNEALAAQKAEIESDLQIISGNTELLAMPIVREYFKNKFKAI